MRRKRLKKRVEFTDEKASEMASEDGSSSEDTLSGLDSSSDDSSDESGENNAAFVHALSNMVDIDGSENVSLTLTSATTFGSRSVKMNYSLEAWLLQSKMENFLYQQTRYVKRMDTTAAGDGRSGGKRGGGTAPGGPSA